MVLLDAGNLPAAHAFSNAWMCRMAESIMMLTEYAIYEGVFGCWNTLHKPKVSLDT
jgi:hypothetical protein